MPLVIQNQGEADAAAAFVGKSQLPALVLRLFTNDITPSESDTLSQYVEADINGYAGIALDPDEWVIVEGAPTSASYPEQVFGLTEAGVVYGYYLARAAGGRLAGSERFFAGPYVVPQGGGPIKITPRIDFA